jgi:hypothetical protein
MKSRPRPSDVADNGKGRIDVHRSAAWPSEITTAPEALQPQPNEPLARHYDARRGRRCKRLRFRKVREPLLEPAVGELARRQLGAVGGTQSSTDSLA